MKFAKIIILLSILLAAVLCYYLIDSVKSVEENTGDALSNTSNNQSEMNHDTVQFPYEKLALEDSKGNSVAEPDQSILKGEKISLIKESNTVPDSISKTVAIVTETKNIGNTPADVKLASEKKAAEEKAKKKNNGLEIENLLLNETVTKIGKDFYDVFYKNWSPPQNGDNNVIIIQEKPMPSMGTRITIKVNDYYVFQQVLQPRYEAIREAAEAGVARVSSFINNYNQIQKDLQGEDMSGTGIY